MVEPSARGQAPTGAGNNSRDPDPPPQLPGTEHVWLGPPETPSPRAATPPPSVSRGRAVGRAPPGPSSAQAGLSSDALLPALLTPRRTCPRQGGVQPGVSPPPPPSFGAWLCVWLASHPSFSLAGEPLSPGPRAPACSPALSASPAISRRPQPGQSGLMHSPTLTPAPWGCLSKARPWGENRG